MDKLLAHIDIAQESGTANPTAGSTRVAARTSGQVVTRSSAGVESALGGALSVASVVLSAPVTGLINDYQNVTGVFVNIPAGKTATIYVFVGNTVQNTGALANTIGGGFSVTNPAGANAAVAGSFFLNICGSGGGAAQAGNSLDGDVFSVAAGGTFNGQDAVSLTPTGGAILPVIAKVTLVNASTTTSCRVDARGKPFGAAGTSFPIGSGIFAIIT